MKLNPKQLEKAMKKFGMNQTDIAASLVVIYTPNGELHITNPQVAKVVMMGQESFQISGTVVEKSREIQISEEDIETVMGQSNATRDDALAAIKKHEGDLASAIMELAK
jgi:nascent polypeptide-associated complex subunit alpha